MFSSSFRRALGITRNASSSRDSLDELHSQKSGDPSVVSEEGILGGNEPSTLHPATDKLLPGLPVQSTYSENLSQGLPKLSYSYTISGHADQPLEGETKKVDSVVSNIDISNDRFSNKPTKAESPTSLDPDSLPSNNETKPPNSAPLRPRRSNAAFHPFLHNLAVISVTETESTTKPPSQIQDHPENHSRPEWVSSFLSTVVASPKSTSASTPTSSSTSEADDQDKARRRKRPQNTFLSLQPIDESGDNVSIQPKPSTSSFAPNIMGLDSSFARKMEETGRLRRLQSQSSLNTNSTVTTSPVLPQTPVKTPTTPEKPKNGTAHLKAHSEGDLLPRPAPKIPSPPRPLASANGQAKAHSEGDLLPGPAPKIPSPARPLASANGQAKVVDSQTEDQTVLQDLLDRTLRELKAAREETARVKAQSDREKSRLVQELNATHETLDALQKESRAQNVKVYNLEVQLKKAEKDLKEVTQEKQGWQEQLDTMHHRLTQAERQVRSLDQLTRSKLEVRQEGIFGPTKRSQKAPQAKEPSMEVIGAVGALNEEILQTANLLVENLERTKTTGTTEDVTRAKAVLGNKVVSMMQIQANDHSKGFRFLLMQVVLEVFMVHWSTNIIEAWYPHQKSFADLLIEMSSKTTVTASVQGSQRVDCGKVKILQTDSNATVTIRFPEWVVDVIKDLTRILSVAGLRIRPNRSALFTSKLLTLVKIAYDVRTALAEKDICGDLELSVVGPDMPFQAKWMDEAHAMSRKNVLTTMQMEPIAGTSGMGLQRSTKPNNNPIVVLKPKVVLARVLDESP